MDEDTRCKDCKYFRAVPLPPHGNLDFGECHRYPPTHVPKRECAEFPTPYKHDWCAEYFPKKET